ncbi:PAS domain-containing sensor histidine kinase [Winogradskyella sp.]|jgi:PAS domain S-box-containing protein|uniref:PAS domain-containing sensor histidine kinase n=1 Tax=Winogradskyella sp. TaxID=1883156 RepID=UPI0025FA31AC|nr:PAS domain-containing sensor histidine kinase [Winogradskyella sp.]MCT4629459.1 PAS domain-containing sensor histidine kinase [Winogradskyella sp.]
MKIFGGNISTKKNVKPNEEERNIYKVGFKISNIGLWDWNTVTNKVFYSDESLKILGYHSKQFKNLPEEWDKRVHPDDKDSYFNVFNQHINGELETYENEYRVLCKDGSYKWILDTGKVIQRDETGKPQRIVGTHKDITETKKNENLLKNNIQLITSQNKRLHNFTHIVSHNLKTHIGNLKNILEFYEDTNNTNEKEELITHLKTISNSLTNTIVDLNDIISIKSKTDINDLYEVVNLYNYVENITESLEVESSKANVTIHNALRKDDAIKTNASYIESILYNIISNGIKYADPNKNSRIGIQSVHSKDEIKILISDNGIGIDLSKFENKLFEMYQTFHGTDREDSRGVGLYITKTQIEALGGKIEVESSLGEGTAFIITFKKTKA